MLTKYRALLAAVDCGTLTKAVETMHCTQSALSRMIRDLEDIWGLQLLIRGKSGVRPTPDCLKLLPTVRRICAGDAQLKETIADIRGLATGTVRIGVFSSIATFWLPRVIARFKKQYPGIEFEILLGDYAEIESWVAQSRVDFGFVATPTIDSVKALPLHDDELLAILPCKHKLARKKAVKIEDLAQESLIMLEKGKRAEISRLFESRNLAPNVKFRTFDDYALLNMVENGIAVGILPKLILERLNYKVEVRPLKPRSYREIALIVNDTVGLAPAAQRFLSVFNEELHPIFNRKPDFDAFFSDNFVR